MFFSFSRNQFKAHGVDNKVFQPPKLPAKKELKGTTVEPFHLSVSHKKEVSVNSILKKIRANFNFHVFPRILHQRLKLLTIIFTPSPRQNLMRLTWNVNQNL